MKFHEILKSLRKENELTAKELSQQLSCSTNIIYDWEHGRCEPSYSTLTLLAKFFQVSIDYLLGIEDDFVKPEIQTTLSYREQKLLKAFNLLEDDEKDKIIEDCEYFANKHIKTNQQKRA